MTRSYFVLCIAVVLLTVVATAAVYPWLPERIPTHWNFQGQIDAHGSKQIMFLMPALMVGLLPLFLSLPWMSPKQFDLERSRDVYGFIVLLVMLMFAYLHGLIVWAGFRGDIDITRAILAGALIVFGQIGQAMTGVRRNFWVGVRTPWTIASERVWEDTHRLAARMFVAAAATGLFVLLLPLPVPAVISGVLGLIMLAAVWPAIYSLILYKRLEGRGEI